MITVKKIGVIGSGIMGAGIAQAAAQAGFQVAMNDIGQEQINKGLAAIKSSLKLLKDKNKISEEMDDILARIKTTLNLEEAVKDSDLIIEAIPEFLDMKKELFAEMDGICPERTILASNTSSISITAIASTTKRPDRVIGIHFSNPVAVMPGVELIKGLDTSDDTVEVAKQIISKMGKETYVALDFPGFIGNRLLMLFINEAMNLLWQHIGTAEDIDKACRIAFRHPMGPLELADFIGLDTVLAITDYLHKEISEKYRPSPLLKQLVTGGHYGRKTGRGVHRYDK